MVDTEGGRNTIDGGVGTDNLILGGDQTGTTIKNVEKLTLSGFVIISMANINQFATVQASSPSLLYVNFATPGTLKAKFAADQVVELDLADGDTNINLSYSNADVTIDGFLADHGKKTVVTGSGDDWIKFLEGAVDINTSGGDDKIISSGASGKIEGGAGYDVLTASFDNSFLSVSGIEVLNAGYSLVASAAFYNSFSEISFDNAQAEAVLSLSQAGSVVLKVGDGVEGTFNGTEFADSINISTADARWTVNAGDGNDRAIGGRASDELLGGGGNDVLDGSAGSDKVDGGIGNDTLIGGAGADKLIGGAGTDTASYATSTAGVVVNMTSMASNKGDAFGDTFSGIENLLGSNYADTLFGDAGANVINAANGNDSIYGAIGTDRLTGGAGADTFIYKAVSESSASVYDTIVDFSESQHDKIDLSAIDASIKVAGNNAFVFVGNKAFTGVADQLRFQTSSLGTDIFTDINGDKIADLKIHLGTAQVLQAGDFIL